MFVLRVIDLLDILIFLSHTCTVHARQIPEYNYRPKKCKVVVLFGSRQEVLKAIR